MKSPLYIIVFITCFQALQNLSFGQTYDSQNVNLLGQWDDSTIVAESVFGIRYNGIWGWENPVDGRRYAIVGTSRSTVFLEVTNPNQPILRYEVPGRRDHCIWRELKTYGKYAYMVSDDEYPNSLQIADLSYLPDSVHLVMDSDSIFARTHTIIIDKDKLYCASVKTNPSNLDFSSMNVYSLQNPENPLLLRRLDLDFTLGGNQVHDMWVRNDTVFASCGYDGLTIMKYNESQNKFDIISTLSGYPFAGYNHSSTWSSDGKVLVMTDEVPESLPAKVVDVSNLAEPFIVANFNSSDSATPHNPYFIGNSRVCVMSNYEDGTQIYDISVPDSPQRLGYFDTHYQTTPLTNAGDYAGNWGSFVDFGGGLVLSNDMQNGVYVLDISPSLLSINNSEFQKVKFWPNPTSDLIFVNPLLANTIKSFQITNLTGKMELNGNNWPVQGLNIKQLPDGIYTLTLNQEGFKHNLKVVKN